MSSVYRHQKNHQPQTLPLNKKRIPLPNFEMTGEKKMIFTLSLLLLYALFHKKSTLLSKLPQDISQSYYFI